MIKILVFSLLQIALHALELSPFPLPFSIYLDLHSPIVQNNVVDSNHPLFFQSRLRIHPLFTLTVVPLWSNLCTSYKVLRFPAIRIFSKSEDTRLWKAASRVSPENAFSNLGWTNKLLKVLPLWIRIDLW